MRYLTKSEVSELGHEPYISYGEDVYTFRHANTQQILAHGSDEYETTLLLADFGECGIAPNQLHFGYRY